MKKMKFVVALCMVLMFLVPAAASARDIAPFESTGWLEKNLKNPKLVIVDVRKPEEYGAGHIPGAVNVFYGSWAIKKGELLNELPADEDLRDVISSVGIEPMSWVVVVGKNAAVPDRWDSTRVAFTLKYAGVDNVAVLDGGYDKWVAEKKPVSKDKVVPKKKAYNGKFNKAIVVNKAYTLGALDKALIVDVRAPEFYKGEKKLGFVAKTGRIKGAVNLPAALLFNPDGTYKDKAGIEAATKPVVGSDLSREIVVYCDTGKVCTGWWLALADLLGYKNVKVYDGSSMEWMKDAMAPSAP
ncbi:MAG TPA: rhodanese-like domain-containing protein [Syntrophales bacterium]|nr:rhodanese-like domain-containing protein [Syntrophales bacterium]HQM30035.1 rhodanese-like domain-containing protein [Syntrophales bacterium]